MRDESDGSKQVLNISIFYYIYIYIFFFWVHAPLSLSGPWRWRVVGGSVRCRCRSAIAHMRRCGAKRGSTASGGSHHHAPRAPGRHLSRRSTGDRGGRPQHNLGRVLDRRPPGRPVRQAALPCPIAHRHCNQPLSPGHPPWFSRAGTGRRPTRRPSAAAACS